MNWKLNITIKLDVHLHIFPQEVPNEMDVIY